MAPFLVQVSLQSNSGLPKDRYVNTFHVDEGNGAFSTVVDRIFTFYETIGPYLSGHIERGAGNGHSVKIYDVADPTPRVPVYDEPDFYLGGAAASAAPLPSEVACCLSYRAEIFSGDVAARKRARVYIGPLNQAASTIVNGEEARPNVTFVDDLTAAGVVLFTDSGLNPQFGVWSPTGSTLSAPIRMVWVDNAFDTIRGRGPDATSRETATVN